MATEPKKNQEFYCYITRITLDYNNIINDDQILRNWIKKLNMLKPNLAKCYQKIIGRYGATEKTIDAYIEIILNSFREGTIKETIRHYNEIRDKEVQEDIERERIIIARKLQRSHINLTDTIYIEMLTTEDSRAAKNLYLEFKKELSEYEYEDEDEYIEKIEGYMDDFIQNLSVYMKDTPPSLYIIYMCWCIYNKQWFTLDDKITFHIFEDTGEEVTVNLNEALFIKDNKLFISKTI
jgi:hypothetical protein